MRRIMAVAAAVLPRTTHRLRDDARPHSKRLFESGFLPSANFATILEISETPEILPILRQFGAPNGAPNRGLR